MRVLHMMYRTEKKRSAFGFMSKIKGLCSFAAPFLAYNLGGRIRPVLAGYKITNKCNLKCVHCPYWKRSGPDENFEGVVATLTRLRQMGVRILILEGGEPLLWRDSERSIRDVVAEARNLFPCVCMTTNGILPWGDLPLDRVWVSLDGPPPIHDAIRGEGTFEQVWDNLEREGKGRAFVSTTINATNASAIPDLLTMLRSLVEGVTIQFHYPYEGLPDPLFIPVVERRPILEELIRLKQLGYPVANSFSSLLELKNERWTCEDRLLANAEPDGTILHGCYLKNRGSSECSLCGFTAHNEMSLAFRGGFQSILTGAKIFFSGSFVKGASIANEKSI
jgi:Fe-coproporphyrin III synthase